MRKHLPKIGVLLLTGLLLAGCSNIQTPFNSGEPSQGENNETHEVELPSVPTALPDSQITQGLPPGFPEIPTVAEQYVTGTFITTPPAGGKGSWNIHIISDASLDEVETQFLAKGYQQNAIDMDNVVGFQNENFMVTVTESEASGSKVFVYFIVEV